MSMITLIVKISFLVPSPQDCSLRKQKIILKEEASCAHIVNSTSLPRNSAQLTENRPECVQSHDVASQTIYSFPPILPKEIEDLLKKFRHDESQDNDCNTTSKCFLNTSSQSNRSMMDISVLRRKLFINHPDSPECDDMPSESFGAHLNFSPPPRTPELTRNGDDQVVNSATQKSNDSFGDMFGELSPIRSCSSPTEFSHDISMLSDCGKEQTPSARRYRNLKTKGKNLSESFTKFKDEVLCDKENQLEDLLTKPKRFERFDSGFSADEDFKASAEFMQF